jgi:hypothetical protein
VTLVTHNEALRIAENIAKLPNFLTKTRVKLRGNVSQIGVRARMN